MECEQFFRELWADFCVIAPAAARIRASFEARGEHVRNDHVAFRTFNLAPMRLADLEPFLLHLGYERFAPYRFEQKRLQAVGYVHPDRTLPRVFLSELMVEEFSEPLQAIVRGLVSQVDPQRLRSPSLFWAGRLWGAVSLEDYELLARESEYAAWMAALGLHANHFTVSVNGLRQFPSVASVLDFVQEQGFGINEAGGRVKGSPRELLEQGSTLAERRPVEFAGGVQHEIPTCYYEFALRYPDASGNLYDGFVAASADKIFESTDRRAT